MEDVIVVDTHETAKYTIVQLYGMMMLIFIDGLAVGAAVGMMWMNR